MFDFIYKAFSYLMKFCLIISGNYYVFALFFFALFIQILLLFLSVKQHKSQINMAKVKPYEMAIREKYAGRTDKVTQQKMTMEIQEMYQKKGVNQFSGCLPMLIQLPIILILFAIVRQPIAYSSNLLDNNENFINDKSVVAIEFYEDLKESIIKDSYETEEEYNAKLAEFEAAQINIGAVVSKDGDNAVVSPVTGRNEYVHGNTAAYGDMYLAGDIIGLRAVVEELIEDGHLSSDFMARYEETGFDSIKTELPNFTIGSENLINEPDFDKNIWLMLIPLLVFLTSFLSAKITQKVSGNQQTDANGNPMGGGLFLNVGMPLISAIFAYSMPAAIGVYWIWRTIIGVIQTIIFHKTMPIPKPTEEQLTEARREIKGSVKKKKKKITIEVDEDDDSYRDIEVKQSSSGAARTPRRIEMLTADDTEDEQ